MIWVVKCGVSHTFVVKYVNGPFWVSFRFFAIFRKFLENMWVKIDIDQSHPIHNYWKSSI